MGKVEATVTFPMTLVQNGDFQLFLVGQEKGRESLAFLEHLAFLEYNDDGDCS
jgi:hypothetical protein